MATAASERVHELTDAEAWAILEKAAQRYLGMSAEAFIEAWNAKKFEPNTDRPEVMWVAMLLPLVDAYGWPEPC